MKLSDISIRRPVFASMVSLALVLFGAIGYTRLSVREYPDVDPPIVSVTTVLPGANPQVVESAVTDVLEEELSTVEGLRTLTSGSQEQISNITLEFNLDRDVEAAAQDVRDKVSRVRARLPEDVEEPALRGLTGAVRGTAMRDAEASGAVDATDTRPVATAPPPAPAARTAVTQGHAWTAEEDEELRDGVELGLDLEELSESLELPAEVIGARLEGLGLEPGNGATLGLD